MAESSILLKNGIIMDGSGSPSIRADVLIQGEKIVEIGKIESKNDLNIIDVSKLVIAPGFIDAHTHLDFFFPNPHHPVVLESWIRMGVTTIIAGNCGYSPAPINHQREKDLNIYWNFALPKEGLTYEWTSFGEYLNYLEKVGQAFNVAILVGHNTIRNNVMGFQARFAQKEELIEMRHQIRSALNEGAIGISLGLGYVPGIYSNTEEIRQISSVLTDFNLPLVVHTRGLSNKYHEAVKEMVDVAENNNIKLHLSHHSSITLSTVKKANKIIREAIDRGVKVIGHDNIPYAAACSTAFCALPPKILDGGIDKCIKKLQDPIIRNQIKREIKKVTISWPNWENEYWTDVFLRPTLLSKLLRVKILMHGFRLKKNLQFANWSLKKIAKTLKKDYLDAFLDLMIEEKQGLFFSADIAGGKLGDYFMGKALKDPSCSIITDHVGADFKTPHPVQYGAFPKVIGKFARDMGYFTMEEAIRKMTSLPASQMQIRNRGLIKKGNFADITIFNPKTINAHATFKNSRYSEGVEYVLINGKVVFEKGDYKSNAFAGKVIRSLKTV